MANQSWHGEGNGYRIKVHEKECSARQMMRLTSPILGAVLNFFMFGSADALVGEVGRGILKFILSLAYLSAALSFILFAVILVLTVIQNRYAGSRVVYD